MRRFIIAALITGAVSGADGAVVKSPDGYLSVTVDTEHGQPYYSVSYKGHEMLGRSPLGLVGQGNLDFSRDLKMVSAKEEHIVLNYNLDRIKQSHVDYEANQLKCVFRNARGGEITVVFNVSDNDVAFRYELGRQGETGSIRLMREMTGFRPGADATAFLSPQSDAMIGWKRTKPSYEEEYVVDAPLDSISQYGHGYTFPALFRIGDTGWVLLSETGVDSRYCGSRLGDYNAAGYYPLEFPMPEENNGNGTSEPAFALPGATPWRTITVGDNLAPIVETTVMWDVVEPRFESKYDYKPGKGTWSWILWQDDSINIEDQKKYIDLAAAMGYPYVLVDNWWDNNIGRDRIPELVAYARERGVELMLWYSSSGYWNDIEQGPVNCMDNSILRKKEMRWMQDNGIKGIKVDFFGGDKQETMRLYEEILSDADDHGLTVIFHGCTLPRGWEKMYPNYVGSEAVLASENMIFSQEACDSEAFKATLHPFIRNTVGSMEFGGSFLNRYMNRGNDGGNLRRTTDLYSLATAVLFQSPAQNFAIAPNNLSDSPEICIDFMRKVPTLWDETRFIDGYPGRYVVLARRSGDKWYAVGVNATGSVIRQTVRLPGVSGSRKVEMIYDDSKKHPHRKTVTTDGEGRIEITIEPQSGVVIEY